MQHAMKMKECCALINRDKRSLNKYETESKISLIRAKSACKHRSRESYRESSLLYTKGNDRNKTIDEHSI